MTKLENIVEILTEEILTFQKSVEELKNIQSGFFKNEIKLDLKSVEEKLNEGISKHKKLNQQISNELKLYTNINTKSISMPKWVITGYFITVILMVISFSYSIYLSKSVDLKKELSFQEGRNTIIEHIKEFFIDNPESKAVYDKWVNKN